MSRSGGALQHCLYHVFASAVPHLSSCLVLLDGDVAMASRGTGEACSPAALLWRRCLLSIPAGGLPPFRFLGVLALRAATGEGRGHSGCSDVLLISGPTLHLGRIVGRWAPALRLPPARDLPPVRVSSLSVASMVPLLAARPICGPASRIESPLHGRRGSSWRPATSRCWSEAGAAALSARATRSRGGRSRSRGR